MQQKIHNKPRLESAAETSHFLNSCKRNDKISYNKSQKYSEQYRKYGNFITKNNVAANSSYNCIQCCIIEIYDNTASSKILPNCISLQKIHPNKPRNAILIHLNML